MKTKQSLMLITAFMTFGLLSCNTHVDNKKVAEKINDQKFSNTKLGKDADFVVESYNTGLFEIKAAELAQTKGLSPAIKKMAEEIKTDHTKLNSDLASLATNKGITLPVDLSADFKTKYERLSGLTGKDFDEKYANMMVDGHKDAISAFEKESKEGVDADIKGLAGKTITLLNNHLKMAQEVKQNVKNEVSQTK